MASDYQISITSNTKPNIIKAGTQFFDDYIEKYGGDKVDCLAYLLELAKEREGDDILVRNGIDPAPLEKSVENIRAMVTGIAAGKEELEKNATRMIKELAEKHEAEEATLRAKVESLTEDKKGLEEKIKSLSESNDKAEKELADAKKLTNASEESNAYLKSLLENAEAELEISKEKGNRLEDLEKRYEDIQMKLKQTEQCMQEMKHSYELRIRDAEHDLELEKSAADQKIKDITRNAEREKEISAAEIKEAMQKVIEQLKEQLQAVQSEAVAAKAETRSVHAAVAAELSEKYEAEISRLRDKLDSRTEELMKVNAEISMLRNLTERYRTDAEFDIQQSDNQEG